jgi:hypothetical protein
MQHIVDTKQIISDADGSPYLYRYFIWKPDWLQKLGINPKKAGRIYVHHLIRSDYDRALHDHPWPFLSFMFWGGYTEFSTFEDWTRHAARDFGVCQRRWHMDYKNNDGESICKTFDAPCFLFRSAAWRHRLELKPGQTAWTLVFIGQKQREWGFWTTLKKWCHWKKYDTGNGICEEPELEIA